jgi:hypothetical protein
MTFEQDFLQVKGITGTEEVFGTVDAVTEEKKDMVPIDMLGAELGEIQHELEVVEDARASLEAYDKFLQQAGPDGITRQTAAAMYIGLARIDRQLGQRSALVASMEDNDLAETTNRNKMVKAEGVDSEAINGRGKQLWEKLKELVAKLMAKLKKAWEFFTSKVKEAKEKAVKVGEDIKTWAGPNGPTGGRKVDVPGPIASVVFKDGKVMAPSELLPFIKFAFMDYPAFLQQQFEQVKKAADSNSEFPETKTFLEFTGVLPDGWTVEDDGSGYPSPKYSGDSNATVSHKVRDKRAIVKAMEEVITNCEFIEGKINEKSIMGKLMKDMEDVMGTSSQLHEADAWRNLVRVTTAFSNAAGAVTALERVASMANLQQTRLAGLETDQAVK